MINHKPVLVDEIILGLNLQADGIYIDGTFGRGGHTKAILSNLGQNGRILIFDKDPDAIASAKELQAVDTRVIVNHGSFTTINSVCKKIGFLGKINGILLDLGVSSPQLDNAVRGFSFMREGPLDMRMDPTKGISASQWLKEASEEEIRRILYDYGEERFAKNIAKEIIKERKKNNIMTTTQLANIIKQAIPFVDKHKHPATRTFQAIRIYINNELGDLESVLQPMLDVLSPGGRFAVISFHSLEDRIVKNFIQHEVKGDLYPPEFPIEQHKLNPRLMRIGKAIKASSSEQKNNIRSRSAILRIAEKLELRCNSYAN